MIEKTYTNEELIEIGRKAIEARKRRSEANKDRRKIERALYKQYVEGKLGNVKV